MTDARFPERWLSDKRILRLNAEHFRSFLMSLTWSVSNRTDGIIEPEDLALIPHFAKGSAQAFIDAGLWAPQGHGWSICDFENTQTTAQQLDHLFTARAKGRERQARHRAKQSDDTRVTRDVTRDIPRDITGDVTHDVTHNDTGKARQGKDRHLRDATTDVNKSCQHCGTELPQHMTSQVGRGYCNRPNCHAAYNAAKDKATAR